jgi:hypothetical protein
MSTRLHLSALKVHLAHCAAIPRIGRFFGVTFTTSGIPAVASVPQSH